MISYRTALCLVVGLQGATSVVAWGQAMAPLPIAFRQQAAFTPAEGKTIDTWVAGQLSRLAAQDFGVQKDARDALVAGSNGSSAFGDAYAQSLNNAAVPVIKGTDFRQKLNAAVAVARVAEKTKSAMLHDAAMAIIADKNDGVALWGVKAAKYVVPAMFGAQGASAKTDLINAVSEVALRRGYGPIVAEAYQVLAPQTLPQTPGPLVKATMPALLNLMASRNKAYLTGVPDEPTAENSALLFVSLGDVWPLLTTDDKVAAVQRISDLTGMAGQRYGTASRVDQEHLIPLFVRLGGALTVLSGPKALNSPELAAAAVPLTKVNASIPAAAIQQAAAGVYPILAKVSGFNGLTAPPTVQAMAAPTTQPATAPATTAAPVTTPAAAAPAVKK